MSERGIIYLFSAGTHNFVVYGGKKLDSRSEEKVETGGR